MRMGSLDGKVHNGWIFFDEEIILGESLIK